MFDFSIDPFLYTMVSWFDGRTLRNYKFQGACYGDVSTSLSVSIQWHWKFMRTTSQTSRKLTNQLLEKSIGFSFVYWFRLKEKPSRAQSIVKSELRKTWLSREFSTRDSSRIFEKAFPPLASLFFLASTGEVLFINYRNYEFFSDSSSSSSSSSELHDLSSSCLCDYWLSLGWN